MTGKRKYRVRNLDKQKTHQAETVFLLDGFSAGSGGWIRTTDLRVMSPTSCHCSTPRQQEPAPIRLAPASSQLNGARTCSPSGQTASTPSAAAFHDPVRDGTGWVHGASR